MIDVERTIISQYGNSPVLLQLIQNMNEYIDPRADIDNFYNIIWNVDTAVGFGLDIWGRIVNIKRELEIPSPTAYFGFNEALDFFPFNDEPFYSGESTETQTYTLSDDAYRKVVLTKALANISAATAPAINQLLKNLFADRGKAYVNDQGAMTMRYVFEFDPTDVEFAIITQSGALPRPAGVLSSALAADDPLFGFNEATDAYPFDDGVFLPPGAFHVVI